jgi:hypothetical protein
LIGQHLVGRVPALTLTAAQLAELQVLQKKMTIRRQSPHWRDLE